MQNSTFAKFGLAALGMALPLALPASAAAAPDLRVNVVSVSPQPAAPNAYVTARTRLSNNGSSIADLNQRRGGRTVHIVRWFFKERRTGNEKFVLAMSMLGKLAPRRKKTLNARFRIPSDAKPGMHSICAVVDPQNVIRETNEGNNRNCIRIRVKPGSRGRKPGLKPGIKPDIRPDIKGPGIKPIDPGKLQGQCRNPALVEMHVGIVRKTSRLAGIIEVTVKLKNTGNADYVSQPNQQSVQIHHGPQLLKNERFGNLRKGQVKMITARLPWNAAGEFQDTLKARIVYDPDIRTDGNPRNDDCKMNDNSQTLSPAQVNPLFTG